MPNNANKDYLEMVNPDNPDSTIRIPYKCPVCYGKGVVTPDFYLHCTTTDSACQICKSCNGTGIVWSDKQGKKVRGSVALNPEMREIYEKLKIKELGE